MIMRIGILTYFSSINYGAFLQAYSLQKYLMERYKTADVEIINYTTQRSHDIYINKVLDNDVIIQYRKIAQYKAFIEDWDKLVLSSNALVSDSILEFERYISKQKYDIIIVGSDQVWKINGMRGFPNAYWMNVDIGKTIVKSFAVSGRTDYSMLSRGAIEYISNSLERFNYIGVRDNITKSDLGKLVKKNIYRNTDPVFLNVEYFRSIKSNKNEIKEKYQINIKKPIISIMIANSDFAVKLYEMFSKEYTVINLYCTRIEYKDNDLSSVSPFSWNSIIGNSDFIITDFFHGMLFSIIHEKPFAAFEKESNGRGKIEDFLLRNNMEEELFYYTDYLDEEIWTVHDKMFSIIEAWNKNKISDVIAKELEENESFFESMDKDVL